MKFVKKLLSFVLMATLMTTMAFSSIAYAMPQAEPTVENAGAIEPRSLITHNNYYWNSTNDIQFHVTYVVNDGTAGWWILKMRMYQINRNMCIHIQM